MAKKLAIIGATGGCGKFALSDALKRDDCKVLALVRSPHKIEEPETDNFKKAKVDVCDKDSLTKALPDDVDVVVSCIGRPDGKLNTTVVSEGTKNIIEVMKAKNIKRLLMISSFGMGEGEDESWTQMRKIWTGWFISLFFLTLMKKVREDLNAAELSVRESDLDYVIVRPGILADGPARGNLQEASSRDDLQGSKISRADVGEFMIKEAVESKYSKAAVTIVWKDE